MGIWGISQMPEYLGNFSNAWVTRCGHIYKKDQVIEKFGLGSVNTISGKSAMARTGLARAAATLIKPTNVIANIWG